jgi:hypothetical protein
MTRDFVIPAGTEIDVDPPHRSNYFTDSVLVLTAVTKDTTAHWFMDLKDALSSGLIEEETNAVEDA